MAQPDLLGIVVRDMAAALRFYRLLGLEIPPDQDTEPHVEVAHTRWVPHCLGHPGPWSKVLIRTGLSRPASG